MGLFSQLSSYCARTFVSSEERRGPSWHVGPDDPTILCNVSCDCDGCAVDSKNGVTACNRTCNKCKMRCHKGGIVGHDYCECRLHTGTASGLSCLSPYSPKILNDIVATLSKAGQIPLGLSGIETAPTSKFYGSFVQPFSTLNYAKLSQAIYKGCDDIRAQVGSTFNLIAIHTTINTHVRIGLFKHETTKNYIVAIRGTANGMNAVSNFPYDLTRGLCYKLHGQSIASLVKRWIVQYNISNDKLSLTGHSLGALLVSVIQQKLFTGVEDQPPTCVVFNGPNITKAGNMKHYRVEGDPISFISTVSPWGMTIPHVSTFNHSIFETNAHAHTIGAVVDSLIKHPVD